jgi:hypothetical protein
MRIANGEGFAEDKRQRRWSCGYQAQRSSEQGAPRDRRHIGLSAEIIGVRSLLLMFRAWEDMMSFLKKTEIVPAKPSVA